MSDGLSRSSRISPYRGHIPGMQQVLGRNI